MLSKLHQPTSPFPDAVQCGACRVEDSFKLYKNGYVYNFVMRNQVAIEDPHITLMKALAFQIRHSVPYPGGVPSRTLRDFLIKTSVVAV